MHIHVHVLWQQIGEKVAHAYACVCCRQLIIEKVNHAYACVCLFWQLIGEKVAHAYACVCVLAGDW